MDISFHYFAVKAVALAVGLSEPEAQRIAEYSQPLHGVCDCGR